MGCQEIRYCETPARSWVKKQILGEVTLWSALGRGVVLGEVVAGEVRRYKWTRSPRLSPSVVRRMEDPSQGPRSLTAVRQGGRVLYLKLASCDTQASTICVAMVVAQHVP